MPKKESEPLEKETINLFRGDFEKLQQLYPEIGAGKAIRIIVREHLTKIESQIPKADLPKVSLPG